MSESVSIILGAVMPPMVDYIRTKFGIGNSKVAFWLSLVISIMAGFVVSYSENNFDLTIEGVASNIGFIFATSQAVYKTYWEGSTEREVFLERVN